MNGRTFVNTSYELPQVFRPLHQWDFPMWETRDEINLPHTLGFPKYLIDGTKMVLAKNGSGILQPSVYAETVISAIADSNLPKAARIRESRITVEANTAVTKDQFKDGRITITGGTGVGHSFPVVGNEAGAINAQIEIYIGAQLPIDLDTTSDYLVVSSRYRNLQRGAGSRPAVGFIPVVVPANHYFWLIEQGPTGAIAEAAIDASDGTEIDLRPGGQGRLALRNDSAARAGSQLVATLNQEVDATVGAYMNVIARIGG